MYFIICFGKGSKASLQENCFQSLIQFEKLNSFTIMFFQKKIWMGVCKLPRPNPLAMPPTADLPATLRSPSCTKYSFCFETVCQKIQNKRTTVKQKVHFNRILMWTSFTWKQKSTKWRSITTNFQKYNTYISKNKKAFATSKKAFRQATRCKICFNMQGNDKQQTKLQFLRRPSSHLRTIKVFFQKVIFNITLCNLLPYFAICYLLLC